jgi:hypothetical protein
MTDREKRCADYLTKLACDPDFKLICEANLRFLGIGDQAERDGICKIVEWVMAHKLVAV